MLRLGWCVYMYVYISAVRCGNAARVEEVRLACFLVTRRTLS